MAKLFSTHSFTGLSKERNFTASCITIISDVTASEHKHWNPTVCASIIAIGNLSHNHGNRNKTIADNKPATSD